MAVVSLALGIATTTVCVAHLALMQPACVPVQEAAAAPSQGLSQADPPPAVAGP